MTETQRSDRTGDRDDARTEATAGDDTAVDHAALTSRLGQLEAENRRLRETDQHTSQEYRRTARGLIAVGLLCGVVGLAVTGSDVLFALAGIGLFSGVLTYYLRPRATVSADICGRIYGASARSYDALCADLGLSGRRLYVPVESTTPEDAVRLFVPQQATQETPTASTLQTNSLIADAQSGRYGLSVHPTGGELFGAFQRVVDGPLDADPQVAAQQLSDAVVESFELAKSVSTDLDPQKGQLSVRFVDPLFDRRAGFDHPLVSFFAVGLAVALDTPVDATVTDTEPFSVRLRWETARSTGETAPDTGVEVDTDTADTAQRSTTQPSAGSG